MEKLYTMVAERLGLSATAVKAVAELLDEGATVPFISRYRKERTGSLDEVAVRDIETTLKSVAELIARKEFVAQAIENAGALTPDLKRRLDEAKTITEVEDIYLPFKPKKRTRATIARDKGLEPLATIIMLGRNTDPSSAAARFKGKDVKDEEEALAGATDIIAEWASESTRLRNITRNTYRRNGSLGSTIAKGKEEELAAGPYAQYAEFSKDIRHMSSHQYLALRRAEREGLLKVKYTLSNGADTLDESLTRAFLPPNASRGCSEVIADAVADASKRL
ncbi:MAG: RNA-binding transcriptional accessory protein, partial [Muribaculaceae bacterium]|nr:RNA-binding transcriptional accessory protein [Muribaculaceae bacterium]